MSDLTPEEHMRREFRLATEDPDDDGVYQISKDSLRTLLDALDAAEAKVVEGL